MLADGAAQPLRNQAQILSISGLVASVIISGGLDEKVALHTGLVPAARRGNLGRAVWTGRWVCG